MSGTGDSSGRDARGRFAPGNPGGPGGARRRPFELRRAVQEAVTPEMAEALARRLLRMGLEGTLPAIRLLLEHTGGRPSEAPAEAEPLPLLLPPLRTAADCAAAIDRVIQARIGGAINTEDARLLHDLIQQRRQAIEAADHEQHLADLEAEAQRTDFRVN